MSYDIGLDVKTWDIALQNNDFILIDNAERISQQIKISLQFWLGEWFLNSTLGVPYLERICVKAPNIQHIRQIFRNTIQNVNGVTSVNALDLTVDAAKRVLTVSYTATTTDGVITRKELLNYG